MSLNENGAPRRGSNSFAQDKLRALVERVEQLEEEKKAIGADISEIFKEAKGHGFDTAIMRQVIRLRGMDPTAREERAALIDLYLSAVGPAH